MLNRFLSVFRDYFGFSHREARGFLGLIFLTFLCLLIPFVYRYEFVRKPIDTSATDQRKLDSLVALMQAEEAKQPKFGAPTEKDKTTAERFNEPKLFAFDPNTVDVAGWQQLGLPRWLAERIDKFRGKGGRFSKKEDLLRIYDFPPDLYDQLEPYITIKETTRPFDNDQSQTDYYSNRSHQSTERTPFSTRSMFAEKPAKPQLQPFDINTADTSQLIALKGIGATLAARIVKFRDALGGFVSTEQFGDIYGLDSLGRNELTTYGKIRSAVHKIPVNSATAEELDRHPFLSRRQAQAIVNYREQHGAYTSIESLKPIRLLDLKTIEKLAPYFDF